jgi:hypothetical protein
VCFFQSAAKFNYRFATLGFSDKAKFDDGAMFAIYYPLKELTTAEEARIAERQGSPNCWRRAVS